MKKKVLLFLICTLLLIGSSDAASAPAASMTEEEALIAAFETTEAETLESTISCWTKLNNSFWDIKQVGAEIERIADILGLNEVKTVKNAEKSEQLNKIVLYGIKENKSYSIAVESIKKEEAGETYIIIDVSMDKSYKALKSERTALEGMLPVNAAPANFSSCIVGTYKGKLCEKEVEKKTSTALQAINAKKVEGIKNDELLSISAFSSSVDSYVLSGKQRINVQVAVRFSLYDSKTYVWIGTPLIPVDY